MTASDDTATVRTGWLRFGLAVGMAQTLFVLVLVVLLRVDPSLAVGFAIVASTVGGIALVVYVLYIR
ncbi:hypothetical protein [Natrononativus amylolyticus]|uniref:hypothetical protein n=1 Tax=Natrononativus amylolyticus TaxID=2963434 RepID=UPI0020CC0BE9|nr:hypothetical protein [Natrononativus amylolyticus]